MTPYHFAIKMNCFDFGGAQNGFIMEEKDWRRGKRTTEIEKKKHDRIKEKSARCE